MQAYFRILRYGRPYLRQGLLALLAVLAYTLLSVVSLFAVIPFLRILFGSEAPQAQESLPGAPEGWKDWAYGQLEVFIRTQGPAQALWYFCLGLMLAIALKNAARYFSSFFIAPLEQGVIRGMRSHLFRHLASLDLAFFVRKKKGDILGLVVSDVQVVQEAVIGTLQSALRDPSMMLFILAAMVFLSWELTLFTLIVLPLTALFINFVSKRLKRKARQGQEALGTLISILDEFSGGIRVVKAFGGEAYETNRYLVQNDRFYQKMVSLRRQSELASPVTEIISMAVICAIILYSGRLILGAQGALQADQFILFIVLFSQFLEPLKNFSNALSKIQKGLASWQRIEQLLAEQPALLPPQAPRRLHHFEQALQVSGLHFRYGAAGPDIIQDISFTLHKGRTVALVGPSGGGKSTLADLVVRFYDPQQGSISIDGIDLRELDPGDLRRCIGYVTQEAVLFHDTVLANIAYGEQAPDPERAEAAARVANAHEFIAALPQGYHTRLGERGMTLSGGQRQRIAIARAVYRNPPILILDEATSNLDNESEKLVQEALDRLMQGRTALVIAHRLSTVRHAAEILVIEGGRITARGTHDELMLMQGLYARLYGLS